MASGSFGSFGGSSSPAGANPFAPAATGAPSNLFGGTNSAVAGNAFGGKPLGVCASGTKLRSRRLSSHEASGRPAPLSHQPFAAPVLLQYLPSKPAPASDRRWPQQGSGQAAKLRDSWLPCRRLWTAWCFQQCERKQRLWAARGFPDPRIWAAWHTCLWSWPGRHSWLQLWAASYPRRGIWAASYPWLRPGWHSFHTLWRRRYSR